MNGGYFSHLSSTSRKSNNIRASLLWLCTDMQLKSIPEELLHFYSVYILPKKKKRVVLDHPKIAATMTLLLVVVRLLLSC